MADVPLPIAGGFYVSDSLPISAQECINMYPNIVQAPALNQETLFGTPGMTQLATSGTVGHTNRGAHVMNGIAYFVNNTNLYRLTRTTVSGVDSFAMDNLGAIPGDGPVSMADNGTQLLIMAPGGLGSLWVETTSTFTPDIEAVASNFTANGAPQIVVFIDGFFLLTTDTKKFIISALNDGLTYNALDFGTAESDPDTIVAPVVYKNQLFILGSETAEGFQNIGGADFPFQRTGLFLDKGCFAPFSIVAANQTFMFIGGGPDESPAVWALSGNNFVKVSNTAVDTALDNLTDDEVSNIVGWQYAQKGAYFVGFNLPDQSLVYDTISQRWHQRRSVVDDDRGSPVMTRWRVNSLVSAYGRIIVGDSKDGRIGELSDDVFTEYGRNITRIVSTQPFQNNMNAFFVPKLELTVEAGVGDANTPNPVIGLEISRDGGKTFSDMKFKPIGKVGEYRNRTIWRRNGRMSRMAMFRFTMTDPVKPVIIQLTGDIVG